jgi:hypothetical protein
LEELTRGIAELGGEVVQVRQKLKDLNGLAISALDDSLGTAETVTESATRQSAVTTERSA